MYAIAVCYIFMCHYSYTGMPQIVPIEALYFKMNSFLYSPSHQLFSMTQNDVFLKVFFL